MTDPLDAGPGAEPLEPEASRCLGRTRSWVLNVLVVDGLSILGSALVIRGIGPIAVDADPESLRKILLGGLFVVFAGAMIVLRRLGGRERLAEPSTRASRFFASHVGAAAIGWLALPAGLAYGLAIDPNLGGVAPFWLAAMVLGKLAYPSAVELEGFDEPMAVESESAA
ncbi:hypothetical protein [Paludisphaera soli]|uniref:hypothetical protein n=1 Tax=Paludisphaera soli TaxID=2712865 RepID=UPI0013EB98DA|nr:hypothetical protein [Paludisphaera soli]